MGQAVCLRCDWTGPTDARGRHHRRLWVVDLAAWGPQAMSLVVVRRGPLADACHRPVAWLP